LDRDALFTWSDGTYGGSRASFRRENIGFAGGKMTITAETDCANISPPRRCYPARQSYAAALSPNRQGTVPEMDIWSGELRSRYNNYRYGWYEFKASAPRANGARGFIAEMNVMRDPRNVQWAQLGFNLGLGTPNQVTGVIVNAAGVSDWGQTGGVLSGFEGAPDFSNQQEHVYALAWTPNDVHWFVDGALVLATGADGPVAIPSHSGKIKLAFWVLGDEMAQLPLHATFDYVRFYRYDGEPTYPCAPTPTCLPAPDKTSSAQNNPDEVDYGL
jgi:hypothetical protein